MWADRMWLFLREYGVWADVEYRHSMTPNSGPDAEMSFLPQSGARFWNFDPHRPDRRPTATRSRRHYFQNSGPWDTPIFERTHNYVADGPWVDGSNVAVSQGNSSAG